MASVKSKVKITSTINEAIFEKIKHLNDLQLKVGFLDSKSESYPDGTSVVAVAAQNEFGAVVKVSDAWRARAKKRGVELPEYWKITERPFFRTAMDKNQAKYGRLMKSYLNGTGMAAGKDADTFLRMLGSVMEDDIRKSIDSDVWGDTKPNHPLVIHIKESSHPLIDTGHMRQSVSYEVKDKDG